MGKNVYQHEYRCECGIDYGSCGRTNVFVIEWYRGSDTFIMYHKQHVDDPKSKFERIFGGEDNGASEMIKAINSDTGIDREKYQDEIDKVRGW